MGCQMDSGTDIVYKVDLHEIKVEVPVVSTKIMTIDKVIEKPVEHQVQKIVYVDKPVEVIKEIHVVKEVDKPIYITDWKVVKQPEYIDRF